MKTKNVLHQIKGLGMRKIKLIKIVAFFLIFMCIWFAYKKYIAYNIIQNASNQPPIVFAADFYSGDAGTFKYNIETGKAEKISDYVFHELSYSENYEKIIGVIWEDRFQGLAELDMRDYTFKTIISLNDLNKCVRELSLDEIKYEHSGVTQLRMPKYCKDGYTFFWGYYSTVVCHIKKVNDNWNIAMVNSSRFQGYTYFIKKADGLELLFLETEEKLLSQASKRGTIIEKTIGMNDEKGILDINLTEAIDASGIMDMPDDMSKIVYYEEPEIYIYDLNTKEKKHVTNQYLFCQYILDLKFSSDGRYIFYTVGDIPFFWNGWYRIKFFIVDTETGNKTGLTKWKNGDTFYGIDW